jgi:predicted RND superfamily exporter protein
MTLRVTGNAVVFTGITLAIGVFTWVFSPLQFQADMGILLTFMFLVNMFGAILLLPALATWLLPAKYQHERPAEE